MSSVPRPDNDANKPSSASFSWHRLVRAAARRLYFLIRPAIQPLAWRTRAFLSSEILNALHEQNSLLVVQRQYLREIVAQKQKDDVATPPSQAPKPPVQIVHQFHSGSFTGDAITNSMFLIQGLLRQLGFESDIYVEYRHPELANHLRLIDELPNHSQYVLLVHHSMGYVGFDRVASTPAPKVLVYHNITPAELFPDDPHTQHYIAKGREQLRRWRPLMSAALADSEFNAIELRGVGFDPVHACPLLFDIDQFSPEQKGPNASDEPFTVLFVGRLVPAKGQMELVDAFARFRNVYRQRCRLVLIGRGLTEYIEQIGQRASQHGIADQLILTGPVSDQELHDWYRRADLYVSLSQHEGFGIPLVEAMAYRIPVLAWPAGAVPYTLDGAGELLMDRSPAVVGDAMLRLATDAERRKDVVERQSRSIERFRLQRHIPQLLSALSRAGATSYDSEDARRSLVSNMCFNIVGHALGTYSLAAINRSMARALEAYSPGKVRFVPVETNPIADLSAVPSAEQSAIRTLAARPKQPTGPQVMISHHYPPYIPADQGDLALAMVFWEEALLPESLVGMFNRGFRALLAPSKFVAKVLIDSGISIPVIFAGQPMELDRFFDLRRQRARQNGSRSGPFTFLHVSSCFPRKGVDVLLSAYVKAFRRSDAVKLIIKGFPNQHNDVDDQLSCLRNVCDADLPDIEFLNTDIEQEDLLNLYRQADAIVLPTRGEGFNLVAAESIAAGIPLIVTGYGGHCDFCGPEDVRFVDFQFENSQSHLSSSYSTWVEPSVSDLAIAMQEVFRKACHGQDAPLSCAARARTALRQQLASTEWAARLANVAADLLITPGIRPLRLGWVSTWNLRCGVASYSNMLLGEMFKHDNKLLARTVIFADRRPQELQMVGAARVNQCWSLRDDAQELATAIAVEDVDVLVLQHQRGLITWSSLAWLLQDPRLRNRHVIVTLHGAGTIQELNPDEQKTVVTALQSASRIVVHTIADMNLLKEYGLLENVTLFPHGAPEATKSPLVRDLPTTEAPLIGCHGFFLPGKGIPRLIQAVAVLRQRWPRLRLRLVNAIYPGGISTDEIALCRAHAASLKLEQAIEWMNDFLPHKESIALLSECDLIALPYDESPESASGAVRTALASGVPVATTPIRLFADVGEAVAPIPNSSVEEFADGLGALLANVEARKSIKEKARVWLDEHSWPRLAWRFHGMLSGLHASSPRRRSRASMNKSGQI